MTLFFPPKFEFPARFCMPRDYGWDISLTQICEREAIRLRLPSYDTRFDKGFGPRTSNTYDPIYANLNDFRHQTYLMEKNGNAKRKSSDSVAAGGSSASLASSVPDDLRIGTPPDDSPQIKRRRSAGDGGRETVSRLAERMKGFIEEFGRAHEQLKAAHEEIRLIAKTAEETNEKIAARMDSIEKKLLDRETSISDVKRDISLLKKQFEFKQAAKIATPSGSSGSIPRAPAPTVGTAAKPVVKMPSAVKSSQPSTFPSQKKDEKEPPKRSSPDDFPAVEWDDPYCARCNTDYKKGETHVCKN
jgi:hypothetical protein